MSGKAGTAILILIVVVAGGWFLLKNRNQGLEKPATKSMRIEANIGVKNSPFATLSEEQIRQSVSRVKADMRSMATAIESYFVDWNKYPSALAGGDSRSVVKSNSTMRDLPALSNALTTPIAYITTYFADPFNPDQAARSTFSYYAVKN